MKFNYKLRRVCGPAYGYPVTPASASSAGASAATQWSGSNVVFVQNDNSSNSSGNSNSDRNSANKSKTDSLVVAVGNRIQVTDIQHVTVRTLPVEGRSNIAVLAHSSPWLLAIDVQNRALWIHLYRGIVVHRSAFAQKVRCAVFAPCKKKSSSSCSSPFVAVGTGSHVQVWSTPHCKDTHAFAPLQLHRTFTGLSDDVTDVLWSHDGSVLFASSRDGSARVWTVQTVLNYTPVTLAGHKTPIVGIYFGQQQPPQQEQQRRFVFDPADEDDTAATSTPLLVCTVYTISADGAVVTWECQRDSSSLDGSSDGGEHADDGTGTNHRLDLAHQLVGSTWRVQHRHYLNQEGGATVTATSFARNILSVGFSTGLVGLYEMPGLTNLHTLSVGSSSSASSTLAPKSFNHHLIKACTLNPTGGSGKFQILTNLSAIFSNFKLENSVHESWSASREVTLAC
jgi:periodic tryptophan protein 2